MKDKIDWVEEIMRTTISIGEVEPNPYLFQKFQSRLKNTKAEKLPSYYKTKWAFAVCTILVINFSSIFLYRQHLEEIKIKESLSQELNSGTIYNYINGK